MWRLVVGDWLAWVGASILLKKYVYIPVARPQVQPTCRVVVVRWTILKLNTSLISRVAQHKWDMILIKFSKFFKFSSQGVQHPKSWVVLYYSPSSIWRSSWIYYLNVFSFINNEAVSFNSWESKGLYDVDIVHQQWLSWVFLRKEKG